MGEIEPVSLAFSIASGIVFLVLYYLLDKAKEHYEECQRRRERHLERIHSLAEKATAACLCLRRSARLARRLVNDIAGGLAEASRLGESVECKDVRGEMIRELLEIFGLGAVYTLLLYLTHSISGAEGVISVFGFFALGVYNAYKPYKTRVEETEATSGKIEELLKLAEQGLGELRRKCGKDLREFEDLLSKYPDRE